MENSSRSSSMPSSAYYDWRERYLKDSEVPVSRAEGGAKIRLENAYCRPNACLDSDASYRENRITWGKFSQVLLFVRLEVFYFTPASNIFLVNTRVSTHFPLSRLAYLGRLTPPRSPA